MRTVKAVQEVWIKFRIKNMEGIELASAQASYDWFKRGNTSEPFSEFGHE